MKNRIKRTIKGIIHKLGFDIVRYSSDRVQKFPPDFDRETIDIIRKVTPFTQTSAERIFSLCEAVRYIVKNEVSGAIVECGVWKGGCIMAIAQVLINLDELNREIYLFDTFAGMTSPGSVDIDMRGNSATELLMKTSKSDSTSAWCYASLETVKAAVFGISYSRDKIHFVQGSVEETIPDNAPDQIALLRLDTDWYESTKHELKHLFPRISSGGVLIIDDYGHWQGARQAVDEYIQERKIKILLNRVDYTGRIGIVS